MVPTTVARVHPCATRPRRNDSGASNRNYSPSWILGPRTASKAGTSTTNDKPHHSSAARRLYATPNPLIESSDSSDATNTTNTTNTSAAPPKTRRVVFAVDGTPASEQGLAWLARNILLKSTVSIIELDGRARSLSSSRIWGPHDALSRRTLTMHSHDALSRCTLTTHSRSLARSFAPQDVVHLANVVCDSCTPSTGVGSFSRDGAHTQWAPSRHVLDSALSLLMTNARVSPTPRDSPSFLSPHPSPISPLPSRSLSSLRSTGKSGRSPRRSNRGPTSSRKRCSRPATSPCWRW